MHNLRLLRRTIYPDAALFDLLGASGRLPSGTRASDRQLLYEEAVETLRGYADGLRGRSEAFVLDELVEIDRWLEDVDRRLDNPNTVLNDVRFRLTARDPRLTPDHLEEINEFGGILAEACTDCHTLSNATIARVQRNQSVLRRARFNHRAHVLQRGCLDCHRSIPFFDYLDSPRSIDPAIDAARIQNLPRIEQCQQCHTPQLASDRCLTCHHFHPDKQYLSRLLLK